MHAPKCHRDIPTVLSRHFRTVEAASAKFNHYLTTVRGRTYGASAREKAIRRDDIDSKGDILKTGPSSEYKNRHKIRRYRQEQPATSVDSASSETSDDSDKDSETRQHRERKERRKMEKKERAEKSLGSRLGERRGRERRGSSRPRSWRNSTLGMERVWKRKDQMIRLILTDCHLYLFFE